MDTRFRKKLLRSIVYEATIRSIPVVRINEKDIKRGFQKFKGKSKYDLCPEFLVSVFPELDWKLPPERKPWQTEPRAMMVFDAAAIGFAYWQKHGVPRTQPDQ